MPLLYSKLSLPLLFRVKTRVPKWFFKALPKFTGHSSDIPPTILPLTHTTQSHTESLGIPEHTMHSLLVPVLGGSFLTPICSTVCLVFPSVLQVFTQMSLPQLALPRPLYLKIATLILNLYSSSLYFSSQLFNTLYLFLFICLLSVQRAEAFLSVMFTDRPLAYGAISCIQNVLNN